MKVNFWTLLILLLCAFSPWGNVSAQNDLHTATGLVLDMQGEAIIGAHVQLKNDQKTYGAATNTNGFFSVKNVPAGKYRLSVSYIGYATVDKEVRLSRTKDWQLGNINLREDALHLQTLTVKALAADMQVRGDTLEFSAANYGLSEGSVLEDLIKKLPGAEVDESGKIKINGKEISKILIDGKEFFAGDPKVAGKNLPTNMIDKLQVLERLSDMARMSGFDDGEEETVINLTTKKSLRKGLFGSAYGSYGTVSRYEAGTMINRFSGDSQFTFIAAANNTNNQGFSDLDLDMSQASFINPNSGMGRQRGAVASPMQVPRIDPSKGLTESVVAGVNAATDLFSQLSLNGNGQYGYADQFVRTDRSIINILPDGKNTHQTEHSLDRSYRHNAGVELRLVWKPDSLTELIYRPSLRMNIGRRLYDVDYRTTPEGSETLINEGHYAMKEDSRLWSTFHFLNFSRRLNSRGRTISSMLSFNYRGEDREADHQSEGMPFRKDNNDISRYGYRLWLSYVEPVWSSFFLQGTYSLRQQQQENNRSWDRFVSNDVKTSNGEFSNRFTSQKLGVNLKYIRKFSDFTLGFSVDPSQTHSKRVGSSEISALDTTIRAFNFAPIMSFTYNPRKQTSVRLTYRGRSLQPGLEQLIPIPDDTNPLLEIVGNPTLKPGFAHNLFARIQHYNSASKSSIRSSLFASYFMNAIVPYSQYDPKTGKRTLSYTNESGGYMLHGNASYTRPLGNRGLSLRMSLSGAYSQNPSFVNGQKNTSKGLRTNNRLTLAYQNSFLYTSLNGRLGWSYVTNTTAGKNEINTQDYTFNHEITLNIPWGLSLGSDMNYNANSGFSQDFRNRAVNWDTFVSYSFLAEKRATLRLKIYDMLDQGAAVSSVSTPLTLSEEKVNSMGRHVMLHFIYKFDSFSGGASHKDMKLPASTMPGPRRH